MSGMSCHQSAWCHVIRRNAAVRHRPYKWCSCERRPTQPLPRRKAYVDELQVDFALSSIDVLNDVTEREHGVRSRLEGGQQLLDEVQIAQIVVPGPHEVGRRRLCEHELEILRRVERSRLPKVAYPIVACCKLTADPFGCVARGIVGDDDLHVVDGLGDDVLQRGRQRSGAIVDGHAHADFRLWPGSFVHGNTKTHPSSTVTLSHGRPHGRTLAACPAASARRSALYHRCYCRLKKHVHQTCAKR